MKIVLIRRVGRWTLKRPGGLVVCANLICQHLKDVGVEVVQWSDRRPLEKVPPGTDLIWLYGEFEPAPAHVQTAHQANVPILINSTFDCTSERSHWIIQRLRKWTPGDWPGVFFAVFTFGAEFDDPILQHIRDQVVAIPQPLKIGAPPKTMPFAKRRGVCIGDFAKSWKGRLHRGMDVEGALHRLHEAGIPITAFSQYSIRHTVPDWITIKPYQRQGFIPSLANFRLFISVVAHETFAMVPIEAQSVGTPVLYRHMPQSLTQCIGHTGYLYQDEDDLVKSAQTLYHDKHLWATYKKAGVHNARAHQAALSSGHLKMRLQRVIDRYKTAIGDNPVPVPRQGKVVRSFWARYSNNFGDILTPVVLKHLGVETRWVGKGASGKLMAVGSILDRMRENDVIWGTGAIPPKKGGLYKPPKGVRFLAVRGPKTRSLIDGEVPEIYGDPALLLPRIYTPKFTKEFEIGVIPHEVEKDIPPLDDPKVLWIDINAGLEAVIDQIARCELIASSSLHGVIAAEAYGIPAVWVKMTNRVHGGAFKYNDYYLSTGREPAPVILWSTGLANVVKQVRPLPKFDSEPLVKALQDYLKE